MRKNIIKLFCLTLVLALGMTFSSRALAATVGFSVDRSVVMLRVEGGKDLSFSFNATNNTGFDQTVHLEEKDIAIGDENAVIFPDVAGGPSTWVTFQQNDFVIPAGQSQMISANVKIPQGQENGAKMMTMVSFFSSDNSVQVGPKVEGNIGVYTILSGKDLHKASGVIENFSYPKFVSNSMIMSVAYANSGDVQFVPQTKISILNLLNKKTTEVPFENHFVFPGNKFTFTNDISELSPFGVYKLKVSFTDGNGNLLEKTGFAVGKYFPLAFLFALIFLGYLSLMLMRIRKRNK